MKDKKNILIVSQSKVGLTETFIRAHMEQLDGNIFHLYGYYLKYYTKDDNPLKEVYKPIQNWTDKLKSLLPHYYYFRIEKKKSKANTDEALIKKYILDHKIDVVLAEYGTTGSFIAPVCKSLNIPLIVHFHGFDASRYDILQKFKDGYAFMFRYAKTIFAVSHAMKKALIAHGCPEEKIILNTYGPNSEYLDITPNYESNILVSVGRQTYKKAPYLTILAFQKVLKSYPNLELRMIGDGELLEVSKNMIKSLKLEKNIKLLGGLERKHIIEELEQSFLFVQHSLVAANGDSDGTPVGIIEAMAAGLPIVSTRHAGIPDVVIENETGFLVDEEDIEAMANYMIKLTENRTLAKSFGTKGKERIINHYSIEKHLSLIDDTIWNTLKT